MSAGEVAALMQSKDANIQTLQQQVDALKHQLEWFKRQVFGSKSERYAPQPDPSQLYLGEVLPTPHERSALGVGRGERQFELRRQFQCQFARVPRVVVHVRLENWADWRQPVLEVEQVFATEQELVDQIARDVEATRRATRPA